MLETESQPDRLAVVVRFYRLISGYFRPNRSQGAATVVNLDRITLLCALVVRFRRIGAFEKRWCSVGVASSIRWAERPNSLPAAERQLTQRSARTLEHSQDEIGLRVARFLVAKFLLRPKGDVYTKPFFGSVAYRNRSSRRRALFE